MTFLLVPHQVSQTTAKIWVGWVGDSGDSVEDDTDSRSLKLEVRPENAGSVQEIEIYRANWQEWNTKAEEENEETIVDSSRSCLPEERSPKTQGIRKGTLSYQTTVRKVKYQRVEIQDLLPGESYSLELCVDPLTAADTREKHLREGRVKTLPAELPVGEENPFTILLGSCFYSPNDPDSMVGVTYSLIPEKQRPDLKILCGDQVYLDNPWRETTLRWQTSKVARGSFKRMLLNKYEDNWIQRPGAGGLRRLLKDGANYFCSDDHEFWNNAPDIGMVGLANTITEESRRWWFARATELLCAFQSSSPLVQFEVEPLSVCIVDTRVNRAPNGQRFMAEDDLRAVVQWIDNLEGPGVLVVGQPVLVKENSIHMLRNEGLRSGIKSFLSGDWFTRIKNLPRDAVGFFDRGLPDYPEQYDTLMRHIRESKHSIVVLTGDVHFARVAYLEPNSDSETTRFVEVIASPSSVVTNWRGKRKVGSCTPAPSLGTADITSTSPFPENDQQEHFATIEFSSVKDSEVNKVSKVNMKIKYWPILESGDPPTATYTESYVFSLS